MADGNIVSSSIPEEFTKVRGEVTEAIGRECGIRASGEEIFVEKGTKIYLNDVILSPDNASVVLAIGESGFLSLGQAQKVPFTKGRSQKAGPRTLKKKSETLKKKGIS